MLLCSDGPWGYDLSERVEAECPLSLKYFLKAMRRGHRVFWVAVWVVEVQPLEAQ